MGEVLQFRPRPAADVVFHGREQIRAAWIAAKAANEAIAAAKTADEIIIEAMFLAMSKPQRMKAMRGIFHASHEHPEVEGLREALHKVDRLMGVRS